MIFKDHTWTHETAVTAQISWLRNCAQKPHSPRMPRAIKPVIASDMSSQVRVIRGQRVLLDSDPAALHGVSTKRLNEQVRRNAGRFPGDFLISLSNQDIASSRPQFATLKTARDEHRKCTQRAFTEHGAIMAATILNSPRAVQMSVYAAILALMGPATTAQ